MADRSAPPPRLSLFIYKEGFRHNQFGYASAGSLVLFVIIAVVTLVQLRLRRRDLESDRTHRRRLSVDVGVALALGAADHCVPLLWMLIGSFKPQRESLDFPPTLLPLAPTIEHYDDCSPSSTSAATSSTRCSSCSSASSAS